MHIIAFGLLMMPAQVPLQATPEESRTRVEPIFRDPPPPPPPPIEVQVVERTRALPTVSYTHLDVYKRQHGVLFLAGGHQPQRGRHRVGAT